MKILNSWDQNNMVINLTEFLMSVPELNTLSNDELEMLDKIMLVDHYPDGHKFKSNDNIYLIIDGHVAERYKNESGVMQLNHRHSGDLFGLFSIIDNSKQRATCTANGSVRAASLPRSAFELLFNSKLPLGNHFRRIVKLMREADKNNHGINDIDTSNPDEQQSYDFLHISTGLGQSCHVHQW